MLIEETELFCNRLNFFNVSSKYLNDDRSASVYSVNLDLRNNVRKNS